MTRPDWHPPLLVAHPQVAHHWRQWDQSTIDTPIAPGGVLDGLISLGVLPAGLPPLRYLLDRIARSQKGVGEGACTTSGGSAAQRCTLAQQQPWAARLAQSSGLLFKTFNLEGEMDRLLLWPPSIAPPPPLRA